MLSLSPSPSLLSNNFGVTPFKMAQRTSSVGHTSPPQRSHIFGKSAQVACLSRLATLAQRSQKNDAPRPGGRGVCIRERMQTDVRGFGCMITLFSPYTVYSVYVFTCQAKIAKLYKLSILFNACSTYAWPASPS